MRRFQHVLVLILIIIPASKSIAGDTFSLDAWNYAGGWITLKEEFGVRLRESELRISRNGEKDQFKQIPQDKIDALRRAVDHSGFMALREKYGSIGFEFPLCQLTVVYGQKTNKVTIFPYLSSKPSKQEAAEVASFVEVWKTVKQMAGLSSLRNLCHDETAYPGDTEALDAR
jgi:hypothetical protein